MIAVLVVVVLFVKVLERFGLLAAGYDGKETANSFHRDFLFVLFYQSTTCCSTVVYWDCVQTVQQLQSSSVAVCVGLLRCLILILGPRICL